MYYYLKRNQSKSEVFKNMFAGITNKVFPRPWSKITENFVWSAGCPGVHFVLAVGWVLNLSDGSWPWTSLWAQKGTSVFAESCEKKRTISEG